MRNILLNGVSFNPEYCAGHGTLENFIAKNKGRYWHNRKLYTEEEEIQFLTEMYNAGIAIVPPVESKPDEAEKVVKSKKASKKAESPQEEPNEG